MTTDDVIGNGTEYSEQMAFVKVVRVALLFGGAVAGASFAASVDLADLAARIEYGFYSNEPRLIEAARDALARAAPDESGISYYRALAAFRLAQIGLDRGSALGELLDECEKTAPREEKGPGAAEGWILVAACANLAAHTEPMRSLLHQHRREQALDKARALDPTNPRITVVEAWSLSIRPESASPDVQGQLTDLLDRAVVQFGAWQTKQVDPPDWGEAEALAELGAIHLELGSARDARDLIERALLLAPDYDYAAKLRAKLHVQR